MPLVFCEHNKFKALHFNAFGWGFGMLPQEMYFTISLTMQVLPRESRLFLTWEWKDRNYNGGGGVLWNMINIISKFIISLVVVVV